jgi:hypothetical protein
MAEYTTEEKVEAELLTSFTGTTSPTTAQIAVFITEAQELIDRRTGTTFGTAAITNEVLDLNEDNTFSYSQGVNNTRNARYDGMFSLGGGKDMFYLPYQPIVSITSVETNNAGETETDDWQSRTENTGSGGDYRLFSDEGAIVFLKNFPRFGHRSIRVNGVYGFSTVPGVVSELATKLVAERILSAKAKKSQTTSVDSISLEGISIRKNIGQTSQYLASIKRDIEGLWATVGDMIVEAV